jgi:hypothetical protein
MTPKTAFLSTNSRSIFKLLIADIRIPAAIVSFVLVYWVIFLRQTINLDGIFYIRVADLLYQGKLEEAYNLYPWVVYPGLIALVSKIFGLGLENSAHLLTASFSAVLTYVFITLVRDLGGDKKTVVIAALVIVLYPELNESRYQLCRDHGYWAFYLLSLLFFVRYSFKPRWQYAFVWSICMLIAISFRIEGLVFLLFLPGVLFFRNGLPFVRRIQYVVRAHIFNIILLVISLGFLVIGPDFLMVRKTPIIQFFTRLGFSWDGISGNITQKAEIVGSTVLHAYSDEYSILIVILIPVIILVATLFKSLTPLYSGLLLWAPFSKYNFLKKEGFPILTWTIILNSIILLAFILSLGFLQARYTYPLVLSLLVILSFFLVKLYDSFLAIRIISFKKAIPYYLVFFLLILNSLEGIASMPGMSKQYIKESGLWLKDRIKPGENLCTNNVKIIYYLGNMDDLAIQSKRVRETASEEWLEKISLEKCDYYAVWVKHNSSVDSGEISAILGSNSIKEFKNKKDDVVLIFK